MEYFINNKSINIPVDKKPFKIGSEGKVYKIGNEIYKIYYPYMVNEGFGNKEIFHKQLTNIPTQQIILPNGIIYDKDGNYVGYRTKYIEANQQKKTGICKLSTKSFIKNLQILEEDFSILAKNNIIVGDISPLNYLYDEKNKTMYVIDPGRYHKYKSENLVSINQAYLERLLESLIYLEFITYKPTQSKRKNILLRDYISEKRKNELYSIFFQKELKEYNCLYDYAKSLEKHLK